jgi:O-antigen/teichoic acid export membrane protein
VPAPDGPPFAAAASPIPVDRASAASEVSEPSLDADWLASHSVAGPAVRGSIWTIGGYAAGQIVRFVSNLILTRLLFPEVFGLMALVNIFIQGLAMFSDIGVGPAIVQSPRGDDPKFLNTAWTIQAARGAILWLCSWVVAWPVAAFYDQPVLGWLIPAAAFGAVVAGFEATSVHTVQRHLRFERLTIVDLASQVLGIVCTVLFVLVDRSVYGPQHPSAVWGVVGGGLLSATMHMVLSHTALPGIRHRFFIDRVALKALLTFGRWIFVSTVLTFLASQTDRLLFGKLVPFDLFGVYSIAAMLAALPTLAVVKVGATVVFPAYSRLAGREDFKNVYPRVRLPLLLAGGAIVTALIACGPFLIRILYDNRYAQAGWILQLSAAAAWFQILECTNGVALLAQGRVSWVAAGNAAKLVGLSVFLPLGFKLGGFPGAIVGLILAQVAKYLTSAIGTAVQGLPGFGRDTVLTAVTAGLSAFGFWIGSTLNTAYRSNLGGFLGSCATAGGIWAAIGLIYLWHQKVLRRDRAGSDG